MGQEISATAQGKVVIVRDKCGSYVNIVVIEHMAPDIDPTHTPTYSFYGHIDVDKPGGGQWVYEGQFVRRGQIIGRLANTRDESLPETFDAHVHFEIKNAAALTKMPFSTCYCKPVYVEERARGWYVSAGYAGHLFVEPDNYYDLSEPSPPHCDPDSTPPANNSVPRRYYNPGKFIERHGGGSLMDM